MSKHKPGVIWATRLNMGRAYQVVRTNSTSELSLAFFSGGGKPGLSFTVTRGDARLLAKRINQCLDATR